MNRSVNSFHWTILTLTKNPVRNENVWNVPLPMSLVDQLALSDSPLLDTKKVVYALEFVPLQYVTVQ